MVSLIRYLAKIDGLRILIEAGRAQVIHVYDIYTIMLRVSSNRLTWVSFARAHRYRLCEISTPFLNALEWL